MDHHGVLDDGKAQPRAADLLAAALVHPVKPLKNAVQTVLGDADARILHLQDGFAAALPHRYLYGAAPVVVFDGVVAKVIDDAVKQLGDARHGRLPALQPDGDLRHRKVL